MVARKRRRESGPEISGSGSSSPVASAPQQILFVVKNLLGQVLQISLVDDAGEAQSEQVPAHGLSRAVPMDRISPYTHKLVARRYAKVIPAPK